MVELKAIYDSRESFYGKATIKELEGTKTLLSYDTEVAYIKDGKAVIKDFHSQTTLRHIKEFLLQNNFKIGTKNELKEMYFIKESQV